MSISIRWMFLAAALLLIGGRAAAEDAIEARQRYIREHYSKFEYRIAMRDGVRLFTSVYLPNDESKRYPMLLYRTPYSIAPYGADRYRERLSGHEAFEKEGFIFVFQDVRGRYMSEGEFVNMRPLAANMTGGDVDESTDTFDTISWLLTHIPRNNGKVGQWGISYPGFYTSGGAIAAHPALKAVSPQAPIADWYWDDVHRNGAFALVQSFNFFAPFGKRRSGPGTLPADGFKHGTPDGYSWFLNLGPLANVEKLYFKDTVPFWQEIVAHPNYDEFWKDRNILPHLRDIKPAVLVVGGWFDTEDLYGTLKTYSAIEHNSPHTRNALVMGPWAHSEWTQDDGSKLGSAEWGVATSEYFQTQLLLPFFKYYLKGEGKLDTAEATVFETGANRWRRFDAWPPKAASPATFYLQAHGGLSAKPPTNDEDSFDSYVSDPHKPVPYTMTISTSVPQSYMTEDQRFAAWRPDVVVYRSDVLQDDLTFAGPFSANLWVSTTGTDSDWVVKLIDEYPLELPGLAQKKKEAGEAEAYPGGRQMLVRAEVMRGRFRNSFEQPRPFVPGTATSVSFELQDVLHTFKRGHRFMVQIQSTWFPLIDRNPQTYVSNIFEAMPQDFVVVTNKIYHSRDYPSSIRGRVLP